ncbi:trypsin-like peptidase domain-containing protein [Candidatus Saccharibacteria bacterium]|nr:trypsin-like peptidase domain-containing protein [Candidatus Saccharibacteria bacterium]
MSDSDKNDDQKTNVMSKTDGSSDSKKQKKTLQIVGIVLAVFAIGFLGGWLGANSRGYQQQLSGTAETARTTVVAEGELISELAEKVGPSVVSINVKSQQRVQSYFGGSRLYEQEGAGTGFIISKDGIVATNRHVVSSNTDEVTIVLSDGTELTDVKVIGRTASSDPLDVAFLKIGDTKGKELVPVKIGDSSKMKVGDKVIAIGNALGQFQNTVTSGIISGYGRQIEAYDESTYKADTLQNLFQTDAAINQGNSGGPLVNMSGEVIGINTAVAGGGAENIGFAIPVNDVKGLIDSVLEKGKLERPYLGVRYLELTDDYASELGIDQKRGAYIVSGQDGQASIISGSPAEKAGLKEGDIITKVNDEEINENTSLLSAVQKFKVGDTVELTVIRDGQEMKIKAVLEPVPEG